MHLYLDSFLVFFFRFQCFCQPPVKVESDVTLGNKELLDVYYICKLKNNSSMNNAG